MKRICFFSGGMDRGGGTEHMTQMLSNELANHEFEVYVLSKSDKNKSLFYPLDKRVHYCSLDNKKYRGIISLIKDIALLWNYVLKNKIDILINVDVSLGIFSLPLKIICPRLKQVFWEHFHVGYNVENRKMEFLRRKALRFGDYYVTLTEQDANDLKKNYAIKCKILTIPNICDLDYSENEYNYQSKRILSVGNMLPVKGFDIALDVAKIVLDKHPEWEWEFCGDGEELSSIKEKAVNIGIRDKIIFSGRVTDINEHYRNAAIFVMTSRSEGFGLVIVEAQIFHLPVVAFDVPYGPRSLITQNKNGYLVKAFDVEAMAEKIILIIENMEIRKRFSSLASKDLYKYTKDNIVNQWLKILGEL